MATFGAGVFGGPGSGTNVATSGVPLWQLLRSAFRCIGQLRPGFGYAPSELIDGLFILNAMLDSWATDELTSGFCTLTQTFPLGAAKQQYTVGPGGDFNAGRPLKITDAKYIVMTNPSSPLHLPLEVVNSQQHERIHLPLVSSTIPTRLYYNPTFPLGTATLWPVPTNGGDAVLLSAWQPIAGTLTDENALFSVPPGYLNAVRYHLAIALSVEWGKPLNDGVMELATEALAKIQRLNAPSPQMDLDPACPMGNSGRRSGWSRLTGD